MVKFVGWFFSLISLFAGSGCVSGDRTTQQDRFWWQKTPDPAEKPFFDWAFHGPQGPDDAVKIGDYIGWFGILKDCTEVKNRATLTLESRYADEVNVYRGIGDHLSLETVSLFGDGDFTALINGPKASCEARGLALWPGDLVRVYGDARRKDVRGHWVIESVYLRSWPRDQYELAPLRISARTPDGHFARQRSEGRPNESWPALNTDTSVATQSRPVDTEVTRRLIALYMHAKNRSEALRAVNALAEFGGPNAIHTLEAPRKSLPFANQLQGELNQALKRARREVGPSWKPQAANPYWQN